MDSDKHDAGIRCGRDTILRGHETSIGSTGRERWQREGETLRAKEGWEEADDMAME